MTLNQQVEAGHLADRPLAQSVLGFRKRRSALLSHRLICAVDLADEPEPQPPAPSPPEKPLLAAIRCNLPKGQDIPAHLLDTHFRDADQNGDNSLVFEEFLDCAVRTAWSEERLVTDSKERELRHLARVVGLSLPQVEKARHCYDMFDLDNNGLIDEDEFRTAMDEILRIMKLADLPPMQLKRHRLPFNGDGFASFKEFLPWYMSSFEGIQITLPGSGSCKDEGSVSIADASVASMSSSRAPRPSKPQVPTLAAVMEAAHEEETEEVSADEGLDSLAERLLRVQGSMEGKPFSEAGASLMRAAFRQFRIPHGHEVHRQDLAGLLRHLGYVVASEAEVKRLATEFTTYTELDFDEFVRFVGRYAKYERSHLEEVFGHFDGGDGVPVEQIERLTAAAGLVPRPAVVREALHAAHLGEAGSLGVFDFVRVLVAYRHKEGFTQDEVSALRRIFHSASVADGQSGLAPSSLSGALTRMFGIQAKKHVSVMVKKLTHGEGKGHSLGLRRSSLSAGEQGPSPLKFAEFLALCGRLVQAMQQERRDEFERLDLDGSGSLSVSELKAGLEHLDYEPRESAIREVLQEVDLEGDAQLGVDEFLNFITLFDMRDGFLLEELKEIEHTFSMFDSDSSGTMCVTELREALTHLGYAVSLDSVHLLTASVDAGSGCAIGPSEFRRLVRIQRDADLRKLRAAFDAYKEGQYLPAPGIASALNMAIGGSMEDVEGLPVSCQPWATTGGLDCEAFVGLAEESRAARAAGLRKSAGFAQEEVQDFRTAFSAHDQDGRGQLNISEVKSVLEDLGVACRSPWDHLALLEQLEAARTSAQLAGVEGLSHQGGETVGFWELVHVMRLLRSSSGRAAEERVQQAARELRFSMDEVVEFRETFIRLKRRIEGSQSASVCLPQSSSSVAKDGILPTDIRRLLRSVGLSISSRQRETLERQIRLVETTSAGLVTFVGFLRIMRWLLDTDFVSINAVVARESVQQV